FDENGLPVLFRPEYLSYLHTTLGALAGVNAPLSWAAPSAQQRSQFIGLLAQSGLGANAQRIGNSLVDHYAAFANTINPSYFNPNYSLFLMGLTTPWNNGVAPSMRSQVNFEFVTGEAIPIGRMQREAQISAAVAERQLEDDVAALDDYN